jgi:hypothetical protein
LAIGIKRRIDFPFISKDRRSFESFRLLELCSQLLVDPGVVVHADLAERTLDLADLVILTMRLDQES